MAWTLQPSQTETKAKREGGEESSGQKRQMCPGRHDENNVILTETTA